MVLFFLNVRIAGIFFENYTDGTDFFKNMYGLYGFFSKIVRIFSKSFGHPVVLNKIENFHARAFLSLQEVTTFPFPVLRISIGYL